MRIFRLTPLGARLSSSVSAPNNLSWQLLRWLRMSGQATSDQIAPHVGLSEAEVSTALSHLRRKGLVEELGATEYKI